MGVGKGMTEIRHPELLEIKDGDAVSFGATQDWYRETVRRRSGCGPTSSANMMWYLSRTREGARELCRRDASSRAGMLELMETLWHYVTPGNWGVNKTEILSGGIARYGEDIGIPLHCAVLPVSKDAKSRPAVLDLCRFLEEAIADDRPVAFLNLSNGALRNLDNWHWVTLIGFDAASCTARMLDDGRAEDIDMKLWLETTAIGGGFVAADLQPDVLAGLRASSGIGALISRVCERRLRQRCGSSGRNNSNPPA